MAHYSIDGRGHSVLRRLSKSPAGIIAIRAALGEGRSRAWVRKLDHVVGALCVDGFIAFGGRDYEITDAGRDKLADLNDGIECSPNVRIFTRPQTEAAAHV